MAGIGRSGHAGAADSNRGKTSGSDYSVSAIRVPTLGWRLFWKFARNGAIIDVYGTFIMVKVHSDVISVQAMLKGQRVRVP